MRDSPVPIKTDLWARSGCIFCAEDGSRSPSAQNVGRSGAGGRRRKGFKRSGAEHENISLIFRRSAIRIHQSAKLNNYTIRRPELKTSSG